MDRRVVRSRLDPWFLVYRERDIRVDGSFLLSKFARETQEVQVSSGHDCGSAITGVGLGVVR